MTASWMSGRFVVVCLRWSTDDSDQSLSVDNCDQLLLAGLFLAGARGAWAAGSSSSEAVAVQYTGAVERETWDAEYRQSSRTLEYVVAACLDSFGYLVLPAGDAGVESY